MVCKIHALLTGQKISKAIFLVFTSSKKLTKKVSNFALASEIGQIKQKNKCTLLHKIAPR